MNTHKTAARTFGTFFIVAFLSYGIGGSLIDSIVTVPDFLSNVYANQTQIVAGVILMAIVHSFLNIGLPIIMLPILEPYSKRLAYGYLSAAIMATTILAVGTLFLLMLIPLSDGYVKRYGVNLVANLERLREIGEEKWVKEQIEFYKCPECGGEICVHDDECYDCGLKYNPGKVKNEI